jgi:hypothetical protein
LRNLVEDEFDIRAVDAELAELKLALDMLS